MSVAFIALGSNLGDRAATLQAALAALNGPGLRVVRVSSFLDTTPVGGPADQPNYLNAAAELETDLDPATLLARLLEVERQFGRERSVKNAPRTLDLDLLLYDDVVRTDADPIVPHPRMHERMFVLEPLAEIAPEVVHPTLGVIIQRLLNQLREESGAQATDESSVACAPGSKSNSIRGLRTMVTGATSGIGRAIALALAADGADVIVHGRRSGPANEAAGQIAKLGRQSRVVLADLREPAECDRLVAEAWGDGLDVWINNAGADVLTGDAANWPFERKLQELIAVDLQATIRLSRAVGERMQAQGRGVIINMGWDQAETGMAGDSGQLFAAVKAAVMAFSKSLALSLAPLVRVNCLAPGWIKTAWGETASSPWQERAVRETPLGRWGSPEDVAAVACWLCSPAAAFVTGQVIRVNGGAVR